MKFKFILAVIMLYGSTLYAQYPKTATPDTILINIEDYGQICISSTDMFLKYEKVKKRDSLNDLFRLFYNDYKISKKKISTKNPVDVFYYISENDVRKITIKERKADNTEIFLNKSNKNINENYLIRLHIPKHRPTYETVTISVKNEKYFDDIANVNLDSLFHSAKNDLRAKLKAKKMKKLRAYKVMYQNVGNVINPKTNISLIKSAKNHFVVKPLIGVNIRGVGQLVPGINLELSLSRKQIPRYRVGFESFMTIGINGKQDRFFPIINNGFSIYATKNFSRSIRNGFTLGLSSRSLEDKSTNNGNEIVNSVFFQYEVKKIGVRVNLKLPSYDEFRQNLTISSNGLGATYTPISSPYGQTVTFFYLF